MWHSQSSIKFANVNPKGLTVVEELLLVTATEAQPGAPEANLGMLPGMGHGNNNVGRYLLLLNHSGSYGAVIDLLLALGLPNWLVPITNIDTLKEYHHMMGHGVEMGSQSHSLRVVGRSCLSVQVKLGYMADPVALIFWWVGLVPQIYLLVLLSTHYSLMN